MSSPHVFASLVDLFNEIISLLGIRGSRCSYTFPAELEEILSCPSPEISVGDVGGRVVAYAECGSRYAVAEVTRGATTARGKKIGYIECDGSVYMVKIIAAGRKKASGI